MREALELLRQEREGRIFFLALAQSSLGTGAAYVALLLLAYDRLPSPLAISVVLIANLLPSMLLGPLFGALADRVPRRTCVVAADLLRAAAFVGLAFIPDFTVTVVLAAVAGVGTALFTPAALAGLPSLVGKQRLPVAMSLYGALDDLGHTAGPALAFLMLLIGGAEAIMVANGLTFAVSAVLLLSVSLGRSSEPRSGARRSLVAETVEGMKATSSMPGIRLVLVVSSVALFFGGAFNVAELLFVTEDLSAASTGFAVIVALYGLGFVAGSLSGAGGGATETLKRRYLIGLLVMAVGFLGSGLAPSFAVALGTFALAGYGNGLTLVYERLLVQRIVPERLLGRVFGVKDALTAWAFALAFATAGVMIVLVGARSMIIVAGSGALVAWLVAALALGGRWSEASLRGAADLGGDGAASEDRANIAVGQGDGLAPQDDLDQAAHDRGIELGAGVRG